MRNGTRAALLFFVLGFCTCLCLVVLVRSIRKVDVNWPLEKPKAIFNAVFYPVGDCPDCKKISRQYWKVDKLNDDNDIQLATAKKMGYTPFTTNAEFELKKEILVGKGIFQELKETETYTVKKLTHSYPYLVPRAVVLLNEIGVRFEAKLERLEIAPHLMQISSVLRTIEGQDGLGKHNTNAAPISSHMYGTTFDISYKEFLQKNGVPAKEGFCRHDLMRHELAEVFTEMRAEGRCKVVIERHQACFHITVAN